jgi:hypothetical protein
MNYKNQKLILGYITFDELVIFFSGMVIGSAIF